MESITETSLANAPSPSMTLRNEWKETLWVLARGERLRYPPAPKVRELLRMLTELSFTDAVEEQIFCLDLSLLVADIRFPLVWNQPHLHRMLSIQRLRDPAGSFACLLIPASLKNRQGLAFYPVLSALMDKVHTTPCTALQWLEILYMIERNTSLRDIAGLTAGAGLDRLEAQQLQQLRNLRADQLHALGRLLDHSDIRNDRALNLVFYFAQKQAFPHEDLPVMAALFLQFLRDILPLAEERLAGFGYSYLDRAHVREGLPKAYGLFLLWILHHDQQKNALFSIDYPDFANIAFHYPDGYERFQSFDFEQVIHYLPIRWLWELPFLLHHHPGLLLHLAAGLNIRRFPALRLPVNKRVAHQFHILPPAAMLPDNGANESIRQLYWRYLELPEQLFPIAEQYAGFEWLEYNAPGSNYRPRNRRREQFSRWELVLRKIADFSRDRPELTDLDMQDHQALFGYFQHLIDEGLPLNLSGSTLPSIRRRVQDWQREAQRRRERMRRRAERISLVWKGATCRNFTKTVDNVVYHIVQLNSLKALTEEGNTMRHCVASYHPRCAAGFCSIWSLRTQTGGTSRSLLTIEVNEYHRIVQVRGKFNAQPEPKHLKLVKLWADKEGLRYGF